jgi:ATP-dependent Lon protease
MTEQLTNRTLPVLPLTTGVVLPQMVITVALETAEAKAAGDAVAAGGDHELLLVPRLDGTYASVGVIARVESDGQLPSGGRALLVRAIGRARVGVAVPGPDDGDGRALWVEATPVDDGEPSARAVELAVELRATFRALLERTGGRRLADVLRGTDEPGALADLAGWWPELDTGQKLELLETIDVEPRVELVLGWARDALGEAELTDQIRRDVSEGMERTQRDFLLRQQMEAIRKELGDERGDDVDGYRERVQALRVAGVADAVLDAVERELDRYEQMPAQSVERGWVQTWLDTVLGIPWTERAEEHLDVTEARAVLDADHTGLDEVKERIVEFLAVRKLRTERDAARDAEAREAATRDAAIRDADADAAGELGAGGDAPVVPLVSARRRPGTPILALVGPPGVGKTSLGESVARALGRPFVRVALGGVRDEAEIRGHRRTYVGAQPGRIVRAITEAGAMNPVILLDEIDKVGADWRGDPSSALLEVLDPAQNHTFRDHYLELELDLSDVVFLATANVLDQIPGPLLDRLELIGLDGYTEDEKVAIGRDHLLARQVAASGLAEGEVEVTDAALHRIVAEHTHEAGVRSLERAIGKVLRKVATQVAARQPAVTAEPRADHGDPAAPGADVAPIVVDADDVGTYLGKPRFEPEVARRTDRPGVATGLAVTGAGGDVLFVEATSMPGDLELAVTGQLGDVMKESAQIALSYVRSGADELDIDPDALARRFHVHFPAGAVPKDGPSAGITMTTALVSLLTGRPVRSEVGMTGEVTLQGRVLPIGGVKQKVLAAHRAGLTEVILPARNGRDLDDLPESVRSAMTVHLVDDVRDVLALALEPVAEVAAAA